ncbi:MAG: ABC transporter permease [Anaerolineae bacterium]|nr:ABC transporter permease [Anaerolineae bacterium]
MRIIDIAIKDLMQIFRDWKMILFLVAMPLVFTVFMGVAYRGLTAEEDPRLPIAWIQTEEADSLATLLRQDLENDPNIRLEILSQTQQEKAIEQVNSGQYAGLLVVPQGFSDSIGSGAQLVLYADEFSTRGQAAYQVLRASITRLYGSLEIAQITNDLAENNDQSTADITSQALTRWREMNQQKVKIVVEKAINIPEKERPLGGNPYNQTSPGILVMFAIFGIMTSANILVEERKTKTLQRMIATSLSDSEILAGHLLSTFALVLMQQVLLITFGQLFLKVEYFRQPAAIFLVAAMLALWISAMGLTISVFAKNDQQVVLFSLAAMFFFSAFGGSWFPLEGTGEFFSIIGHATPGAWAMDGFQNIIIRGLGFSSSLLPALIIFGYAVLFFIIGAWGFKRMKSQS